MQNSQTADHAALFETRTGSFQNNRSSSTYIIYHSSSCLIYEYSTSSIGCPLIHKYSTFSTGCPMIHECSTLPTSCRLIHKYSTLSTNSPLICEYSTLSTGCPLVHEYTLHWQPTDSQILYLQTCFSVLLTTASSTELLLSTSLNSLTLTKQPVSYTPLDSSSLCLPCVHIWLEIFFLCCTLSVSVWNSLPIPYYFLLDHQTLTHSHLSNHL